MFRYALKPSLPAIGAAICTAFLGLLMGLVTLIALGRFTPLHKSIVEIVNGDQLFYLLLFSCGLGAVTAFFAAYDATPLRETAKTKSGRPILFFGAARQEINRVITSGEKPNVKTGLWLLPNILLSRSQESRNILLLGGHGSGKTGWLRGLIEQVLRRDGKSFILDVKGDMVESLPISAFILVAAADLRSWVWDIAGDLQNRLQMQEFAAKIIAAAERDPMFSNAARAILTDLLVYLQKNHGRNWGWPELAKLCLSPLPEIKTALMSVRAPSATVLDLGGTEEDNRTVLSVLITVWVAALTEILPLAEAWGDVPKERRFSISDWVHKDSKLPRTMIFQMSAEFPELSRAIGAHLMDAIAAFILSPARRSSGARFYTLVLDEFPELAIAAKNLPRLLALGREANVTTIATLQDIGQLERAYGKDSELILARFGIRCVLRLEDGETTKRICSEWIGLRSIRRERERTLEELKAGIRHAYEVVDNDPVIQPQAIADDLRVIREGRRLKIRAMVLGFECVACVDVPMTIWKHQRDAFVPAKWLNGA